MYVIMLIAVGCAIFSWLVDTLHRQLSSSSRTMLIISWTSFVVSVALGVWFIVQALDRHEILIRLSINQVAKIIPLIAISSLGVGYVGCIISFVSGLMHRGTVRSTTEKASFGCIAISALGTFTCVGLLLYDNSYSNGWFTAEGEVATYTIRTNPLDSAGAQVPDTVLNCHTADSIALKARITIHYQISSQVPIYDYYAKREECRRTHAIPFLVSRVQESITQLNIQDMKPQEVTTELHKYLRIKFKENVTCTTFTLIVSRTVISQVYFCREDS